MFVHEGQLLRQVNHGYEEHYDMLMASGLYDALVNSDLLIRHEEINLGRAAKFDAYKILKPDIVPFISYPYEWSFSQLKDAALTTLEVQKRALEFGMTLKDSSAYNIQFYQGRPILIDTLSFQRYQEGEPWAAYRQFCQHFLAPLALMTYTHVGLSQLLKVHIDGIPLDMARSLLPIRTRLKPSMQMHIHLHARFQKKLGNETDVQNRDRRSFKRRAMDGLIDSLESAVRKLKWHPDDTEWGNYESNDSYEEEALNCKMEMVSAFLKDVQPSIVWDLGGNTGQFSRLASAMGIETISFDKDPTAVEKNYLTSVNWKETKLLPLLLDLTNPTPMIGWANSERDSLMERGPADMVLALALIHHLAISENVPFHMIAEFFSRICHWLIIEFVPKHDKKVVHLLASREDIFPTYNEDSFRQEFTKFFNIRTMQQITKSERTLYLMNRK